MDFMSIGFYGFLAVIVGMYYIVPLKCRWLILLGGSILFYYIAAAEGIWLLFGMMLLSYAAALLNEKLRQIEKKWLRCVTFWVSISIILTFLVITKGRELLFSSILHKSTTAWIVPMGLSYFTLQMIAYVTDVYQGKCTAQKNIFKYVLFISFFPQILQGPIPRYEQLQEQLCEGHRFDEKGFSKGLQLIIWGFFLKLMIADKAAIIVNTVFDNYSMYRGCYVWIAAILYSIQLYTDFLACVCIAMGTAGLFGIQLTENFRQPYRAQSVKEFWQQWHISLSNWLRDYIYIPLGGNRKGKIRRYLNILVTFLVSGFWHGSGVRFLFWGFLHGSYQIVADVMKKPKDKIYGWFGMSQDNEIRQWIQRAGTFFWVMLAWIIFRARSLKEGLVIIGCMVRTYNPWILFDDSLFALGLDWKEWLVLLLSIWVLAKVEKMQTKACVRDKILKMPLIIRWILYIAAIMVIYIYGTYGFGFNAQDFIYGGF